MYKIIVYFILHSVVPFGQNVTILESVDNIIFNFIVNFVLGLNICWNQTM